MVDLMPRALLPTRAVLSFSSLTVTAEVSNCPFLIFCTSSIPLIGTAAFLKLLKPSIG